MLCTPRCRAGSRQRTYEVPGVACRQKVTGAPPLGLSRSSSPVRVGSYSGGDDDSVVTRLHPLQATEEVCAVQVLTLVGDDAVGADPGQLQELEDLVDRERVVVRERSVDSRVQL